MKTESTRTKVKRIGVGVAEGGEAGAEAEGAEAEGGKAEAKPGARVVGKRRKKIRKP